MMPRYDTDNYNECLAKAGYKSTDEFLSKNPRMGYNELSAQLTQVPPIVIVREHMSEKSNENQVQTGLKESLYRSIIDKFPDGWPSMEFKMDIIIMLSGWASSMLATCELERYRDRIEYATSYIMENASYGWCPESLNDPLIVGAME